ncbi:hypothetical protein VIGAN_06001800 [Vigna angularis var. angularis]|uniref:Uncharacterized protein n=1 Tax=Vigna angularis var. angularis TaxID=157739 RepID=A0A0S3S8K0_PHAAN|nr:hypothetical protein VIGAN_06001800 [Vigna angularis var. angularis]
MQGLEQFRVKSRSTIEGSSGVVELAVEIRIRCSIFSMTVSVTTTVEGSGDDLEGGILRLGEEVIDSKALESLRNCGIGYSVSVIGYTLLQRLVESIPPPSTYTIEYVPRSS